MLIGLHCKCGKRIKVPEARIGTTGKCPACRAPLRLVAPSYASGADDCQAALEVVAGPDRIGEVVFVGGPGPVEIGRHPERHLVLAGERVSRTHCRLVRLGAGWSIEDARSTAGLLLNGRGVKSGALADGDLLQIGEYQLRYRLHKRSGARAHVESPPLTESHSRTPAPDASRDDLPVGTSYSPDLDDNSLLELGDGDVIAIAPAEAPAAPAATAPAVSSGPVCPSCERSLAPNAKICVACGIDVKTGRAILTSHAADLDTIYVRTEEIVRWLSWIIWWGIYPVASEAFGVRKPYVIRAVAIVTVLTSVMFWVYDSGDSADRVKNYMLWVGSPDVRPLWIPEFYKFSEYGDRAAFETELARITREQSPKQKKPAARGANEDDTESDEAPAALLEQREQAILAAYKSLSPEQRCFGQYSPSQLITHAFLHGGILHLAGNLIFLLVIGSRVNALVGNLPMLVLYPVLAVAAAVIFMATQQHAFICPMVGASGAIMGLAGMYVVLMPVHNVHIASWMRFGLIGGFQLTFKLFAVRGFWLVLFYIGFDILFTVLGMEDGVAHWAHLGGFMAGAGIALVLLFTRLVNCRGGDIVSALLGRHAWSLIGKPDMNRKAPLEYGW